MTLTVSGRPLLVDPGTACYTIDPARRDRFRSTRLHNTLILDGREQSEPAGPFHWATAAAGSRLTWCTSPGFDYVEGTHDGYAPLVHRRAVFSRPGCWMIADRVLGDGEHQAELHWHLDPRWTVTAAGDGWLRADDGAGDPVWIAEPGRRARGGPRRRDRRRARPRLGRAGLRPRRAQHDAAAGPPRRRAVRAGDGAARSDGSSVHRGVDGAGRRSRRSDRGRASTRRRRRHRYRRVWIDDTARRRCGRTCPASGAASCAGHLETDAALLWCRTQGIAAAHARRHRRRQRRADRRRPRPRGAARARRVQRDGRLVPQKDKGMARRCFRVAQCAARSVGTRLAEMTACPVPSTSSCCSRASPSAARSGRWSSSRSGSIRRASARTSRASTGAAACSTTCRRGSRSASSRCEGFANPAAVGPAHRVRGVVPVDQRGDRPHLRPLREHLRPARRGAGRRPRAHRQPPRDPHRRQVARAAAGAASRLSRRPCRGRQLERRARSARARRRPGRPAAADRQRPGRRAFRPGGAAAEHPPHRHGRQPARREGARHAARGGAAHPGAISRRQLHVRRRRAAAGSARDADARPGHHRARPLPGREPRRRADPRRGTTCSCSRRARRPSRTP